MTSRPNFVANYTKGLQVAIAGRIQVRSWDDNEGKKRYTTEVVANECFFADSKKENPENIPGITISDDDSELPF